MSVRMYVSPVSRSTWYVSVQLNDENVGDFARSIENIANQLHFKGRKFCQWVYYTVNIR